MRDKLQDELQTDEKILWIGQPVASSPTRANPIMWLVSFIFTMVTALTFSMAKSSKEYDAWLAAIAFLLSTAYLLCGRFFWRKYRKKNTYYALTNKRAIELVEVFKKTIRSRELANISDITMANYPACRKRFASKRMSLKEKDSGDWL